MSDYFADEDIHPIDKVETVAEHHQWDFDRLAEDQIAMAIDGKWRTYSVTVAWSNSDLTLRLVCTFELNPPEGKEPALYELLNGSNDQCWAGGFTFWKEQKLMVWRYGLILDEDQLVSQSQIDRIINQAILSCERYYPAIQLVIWGDNYTPEKALETAIAEAYGTA